MQKEKNSLLSEREMGIQRLVKAPIDLVWKVWTSPEHIKHWWGPEGFTNTISGMDVRPGGVWEFVMHGPDGTDYKNKHIYKEVVKPTKLVLEHVTAPKFLMTVTFEDRGDQTLVDIHSLFESAEQLREVIKVFKADVGMRQNAERMENYVCDLSRNDFMNEPIIVERIYNAPIENVWNAITDKNEMKKWYFDLSEFRPEVGFEFQFYGEGRKGEKYLHLCKIIDVIPGKKISYTWRYDNYEGNSVVTFELFEEGNKTRLKLTHSGVESFKANGPDFAIESFTQGWTELIGTLLKKHAEQTSDSRN